MRSEEGILLAMRQEWDSVDRLITRI